MQENLQHFDIAIIGRGITGLSAAYHLQKLGAKRLCFFEAPLPIETSDFLPGMIGGSLPDNITRISHRHGLQVTRDIWNWAEAGCQSLFEVAKDWNVPLVRGERIRWILTPEEMREAEQAVSILQRLGFSGEMLSPAQAANMGWSTEIEIKGIQRDGTSAGFLPSEDIRKRLLRETELIPTFQAPTHVAAKHNGISISTKKECIQVEAALVTDHISTKLFIPSIYDRLVPFVDQWHEFFLNLEGEPLRLPTGTSFSWRHGHYWGCVTSPHSVRLGGARFLRPLAGFETSRATLEPNIEKHLQGAWNSLFPSKKLIQKTAEQCGTDCWPSDELPVVGPMFGDSRILVGTGFMGQGLSLGFYSGRCLAELVQGLRPPLPRCLWPERLRSLNDDI